MVFHLLPPVSHTFPQPLCPGLGKKQSFDVRVLPRRQVCWRGMTGRGTGGGKMFIAREVHRKKCDFGEAVVMGREGKIRGERWRFLVSC